MGSKWTHKDRPKPPTLLEQEKTTLEDWKVRTNFWARRIKLAAQPRRIEPQVLTTDQRRHFVTQIKKPLGIR